MMPHGRFWLNTQSSRSCCYGLTHPCVKPSAPNFGTRLAALRRFIATIAYRNVLRQFVATKLNHRRVQEDAEAINPTQVSLRITVGHVFGHGKGAIVVAEAELVAVGVARRFTPASFRANPRQWAIETWVTSAPLGVAHIVIGSQFRTATLFDHIADVEILVRIHIDHFHTIEVGLSKVG